MKRALALYSKQHGLKIRSVVERAIVELIEDEADLELWRERREEPAVSWSQVLAAHRRKAQK
ncbi:MAG: DUF6290 family protein [Bryobacter sp.]|nr:DUF6290 family protein [Bryobacter sp.]